MGRDCSLDKVNESNRGCTRRGASGKLNDQCAHELKGWRIVGGLTPLTRAPVGPKCLHFEAQALYHRVLLNNNLILPHLAVHFKVL